MHFIKLDNKKFDIIEDIKTHDDVCYSDLLAYVIFGWSKYGTLHEKGYRGEFMLDGEVYSVEIKKVQKNES